MARPKKVTDSDKYERLTIRLASDVKEWYVSVADRYGMAYSALMQMVLTNYMTQIQNAEAIRELTNLSKSEVNEESVKVLSELVEVLKEK